MLFRRICLFISSLAVIALLAACGGTTTANTPPATPAPSPTPAAPAVVKTASATVGGKSETILTDAQGKTLYYFTPDTAATVACTGGCAQAWPPLLFTGSGTPTSSTTLPGTLSVVTGSNGAQVEYSGYPLYTFASDTAPGQTTGQGKAGKWYVAIPEMASFVVRVTTGTVAGKPETILTDAQSRTLYYYTPDTATTVACTGGCAQAWPPLLFTGSGTPLADAPLTGTLTTVSGADGTQIVYNGHPLYTFASDTAPGQTTGEGKAGKWHVCTPTLASQ